MTFAERLIAAAVVELGVRESGGNNLGERVQVYQAATWLKPGPWPWCAAFCAFVLRRALLAHGMAPQQADALRCSDASAFGWIAWALRSEICDVLQPSAPPLPGDFVVFDFNGPGAAGGGHIGIVERVSDSDGSFHTVEGNTNDAGARDSDTGDGVLRRRRSARTVVNFLRPVLAP